MNVLLFYVMSAARPGKVQDPRLCGQVQFLVAWYGFEDGDNTWEDVGRLLEDTPCRVCNYLAENAAGHPPPSDPGRLGFFFY